MERERIAELIVETGAAARRGSGYRLTVGAVLTAAHVVADASNVRVRFNADLPDEWITTADVDFADPAGDVAVLRITPRHPEEDIPAALFGRVGERAAVVLCLAVGFPRFKLREYSQRSAAERQSERYRDSHQADGRISSLSNWREGSLEILVAPPERDRDPQHSPWEGMSGAAVWSGGRIIGLVSKHHRSDGLNRLAAVRTDRWYQQMSADRLSRLRELTGLPAAASQLVDVIPAGQAEALAADYTEQVEAIAPPSLLDREAELADLVGFCVGDESYQWWQAGPWAGKTALVAWFVLHPPRGVSVVSFFVTGRLAGQADSSAFTEALIQQLAVVAGELPALAVTPAARDGQRRRLLRQATARAAEEGKRLLLVVDGLDEDRGVPPAGPSSIASLLPDRPPEGLRVLVTSRPHPGVPVDVPGGHPLRSCAVRELARSAHAKYLELEAKRELVEYLQGTDHLRVDIIGYITAAGGGLTVRELIELTQTSGPDVDGRLGSVFGRSIYTRPASDVPPERAEQVYLFAHETLREIAEQQLTNDLNAYRQRIYAWADSYRGQGWPDGTPRYLFRPYARLLAANGERVRLAAAAIDRARHERMLEFTGGDGAALAEIADAQQAFLTQKEPDLTSLMLLAFERDRLEHRNQSLPVSLPAVWVRLGQPNRGLALARSITDASQRVQALGGVIRALAASDPGRAGRTAVEAENAARTLHSESRDKTLIELAITLAHSGQMAEAERITRSITNRNGQRARPLAEVSSALAAAAQMDEAGRVAHDAEAAAQAIPFGFWQWQEVGDVVFALATVGGGVWAHRAAMMISDLGYQITALARMASALVAAGQTDEAERVAHDAEVAAHNTADRQEKARALAAVVSVLAAAGQTDDVKRITHDAEAAANDITDRDDVKAFVLMSLTAALATAGLTDEVERVGASAEVAARATFTDYRIYLLTRVTAAMATAGLTSEVERIGDEAETVARALTYPDDRAQWLTTLAYTLAAAGLALKAQRVARAISSPVKQAVALASVASGLAAANQPGEAKRIASLIPDAEQRAQAQAAIASALADVGQVEEAKQAALAAEVAARAVIRPVWQSEVLISLTKALTAVGQVEEAAQVAHDAEAAAHTIADPAARAEALAGLASALAASHEHEANRVANAISGPVRRARALAGVASALAAAGQADKAERTAQSITNAELRVRALAAAGSALAAAGQTGKAEQVARDAQAATRAITEPNARARALASVASALASAAQENKAKRVADKVTGPVRRASALAGVASALASAGQMEKAQQFAHDAESATGAFTYPGWRARVLTEVASALSAAGQADDAQRAIRHAEVAANLLTGNRRDEALLLIAEYYNRHDWHGSSVPARRTCALILTGSSWPKALPLLCRLEPESLVRIRTALTGGPSSTEPASR